MPLGVSPAGALQSVTRNVPRLRGRYVTVRRAPFNPANCADSPNTPTEDDKNVLSLVELEVNAPLLIDQPSARYGAGFTFYRGAFVVFGGNDALVNPLLYPTPPFWVALAHKQLVGPRVLAVANSTAARQRRPKRKVESGAAWRRRTIAIPDPAAPATTDGGGAAGGGFGQLWRPDAGRCDVCPRGGADGRAAGDRDRADLPCRFRYRFPRCRCPAGPVG